ncbi:hypothetical protein L209DRAFT_561794 [Thermothelomyces heterothallicus CBS 203.75]
MHSSWMVGESCRQQLPPRPPCPRQPQRRSEKVMITCHNQPKGGRGERYCSMVRSSVESSIIILQRKDGRLALRQEPRIYTTVRSTTGIPPVGGLYESIDDCIASTQPAALRTISGAGRYQQHSGWQPVNGRLSPLPSNPPGGDKDRMDRWKGERLCGMDSRAARTFLGSSRCLSDGVRLSLAGPVCILI